MKRPSPKKFNLFISMILFSGAVMFGCAYRIDKSPVSAVDKAEGKSKATFTFKLVKNSVLAPRCFECHSNSTQNAGNVNLETYANVRGVLNDIKECVSSGTMPRAPGTPLSEEEKFLLLKWIEFGAPEVSASPDPTPTPTPAPSPTPPVSDPPTPGLLPTFSSINSLIIQTKCLDCHNSNGKASDSPFEKYSDIVSGFVVVPNSPDKSSLIKHITLGAKVLMPPPAPRSNYKAVAPEDTAIITVWIMNGALNN